MKETDPIEERFRNAFSEFEKAPPPGAWKELHAALHPVAKPLFFAASIKAFSALAGKSLGFYMSLGAFTFFLFFTVFYLASGGRYSVKGHAYAGPGRLHNGAAELFRVADKAMPWDSAMHFRSALIDHTGHFQFSRIPSGDYLLRIAPNRRSGEASEYLPSWYDMHENSDSSELITVGKEDVNVEVHLRSEAK